MKKRNNIFVINIILGFILFIYIFWVRFLRIHLPKGLPFILTLSLLFVIIILCLIYGLQLQKIMQSPQIPSLKPQSHPNFWNVQTAYMLQILYKPLAILQETIITNKYFYPLISFIVEKIILLFIKFSLYQGKRYIILNIIFLLLPRIILALSFFLDIFYFQKLEIFYKIIPIGIIPIIFSLLITCAKTILEKNIETLEKNFIIELNMNDQTEACNYYLDIHMLSNNDAYDDYDPNVKISNARYFIDIQASSLWFGKELYKYKCIETLEARIVYATKYNITLNPLYFVKSNFDAISAELNKEFYALMPYTINLCLFCLCQENNLLDSTFRNTLKFIYALYFFCWLYLLITANYFYISNDILPFLKIFNENIEPFSQNYIDNQDDI